MNRRMFMKVIGMTMAGLAGLPSLMPKALSPIVLPECPGCAAGLPVVKRLGWKLYPLQAIIINDNVIKTMLSEDKENGIGYSLYLGADLTRLDV